MTQDAPLDQAMLAAIPEDVRKLADEARIRVLGPAFVHIGFNDAIRKAAEFAVMADRSALSRRVPASGGELTRYAMETLTGGTIPLPVVRDYGEWVKFSDLAASPIVATPEGLLHEIVSIINTYGLTQVPAGETHPELERLRELVKLAEGKTEPVAWVTPETLADLLNNAPWAAGAIGELSQRKKDNYTAPLFAAPPAPEGKAEPGEAAVIERCAKVAEDHVHYEANRSYQLCYDNGRRDAAKAIRALSTPVKP